MPGHREPRHSQRSCETEYEGGEPLCCPCVTILSQHFNRINQIELLVLESSLCRCLGFRSDLTGPTRKSETVASAHFFGLVLKKCTLADRRIRTTPQAGLCVILLRMGTADLIQRRGMTPKLMGKSTCSAAKIPFNRENAPLAWQMQR